MLVVGGVACGGGKAGGTGQGGQGGGAPNPDAPLIVSFKADPAVLPAGGGTATLSWQVMNADSLTIDNGVGSVSGTSTDVQVSASTIYTLTATNAHGSVRALTAIGVGQNPSHGSSGRYAAMVSPTGGESFTSPAELRLVGVGYDPLISTNVPTDGHGSNAATVQFFVDDAMVASVDGLSAEYWVFSARTTDVGPGQHRVWLRAIYANPAEQLDSPPMIVTAADPPSYASTIDLTGDVMVGSQGYAQVGTAAGRIRLNGHGFQIRSSGTSGAVTLQYVDVFDLGGAVDTGTPGIDVSTSGALTIEDCVFDSSNTVNVELTGSATASVRRNTFRSNMRMRIGQQPFEPDSYPVLSFTGSSTGAKVFAGNNVGASWASFDNARNWVVGGDSDADSNVLIGPRAGITARKTNGVQIRRNYSHHVYYGGWSQGANFELDDAPSLVVEHNVISGSSWPIRGAGCEFRYNLVLEAGHEWLWPGPNGAIHHNVFVGGENDVGGIFLTYNFTGIKVFNNTIDGFQDWKAAIESENGSMAITSNAFVNVPKGPTVNLAGGTLTADYNFFDNAQNNYSDGRHPAHDVGGDAMLTSSGKAFDVDESVIWQRSTTTAALLAIYRTRYLPKAGSPLIDAGDPAGGAGNDIGAVGAGTDNASDKFGVLP